MTTARPAKSPAAPDSAPAKPFRLPDIPERHPDDMTSVDNLHQHGAIANIVQHLGNPESTIVSAEHYVVPGPAYVANESRYPDLLVAFDADPAAYRASNGYIVSEQGKPPDFILEVGSRRSAVDDREGKKDYYERLGVAEYWLFDSGAEFYGFNLAGYRLENGRFQPIPVSEIGPGMVEGYSAILNLNLRAENGNLGWYDPATGEHIPTLQTQTARAEAERAARIRETVRAETAEARVQELEDTIRRLRGRP